MKDKIADMIKRVTGCKISVVNILISYIFKAIEQEYIRKDTKIKCREKYCKNGQRVIKMTTPNPYGGIYKDECPSCDGTDFEQIEVECGVYYKDKHIKSDKCLDCENSQTKKHLGLYCREMPAFWTCKSKGKIKRAMTVGDLI